MLYFAYGSNMDPDGMRARCPGARAIGPTRLADHTLHFVSDLPDGGSAVPTVAPVEGDEVWGVLWDITPAHEEALDEYEGVAQGAYRKEMIDVEVGGKNQTALVYIAVSPDRISPSRGFLELLVRGAEAHGLPSTYVNGIRRL